MFIPSTHLFLDGQQAWMKTQRTLLAKIAMKGPSRYVIPLFLIECALGTPCGLQLSDESQDHVSPALAQPPASLQVPKEMFAQFTLAE